MLLCFINYKQKNIFVKKWKTFLTSYNQGVNEINLHKIFLFCNDVISEIWLEKSVGWDNKKQIIIFFSKTDMI